MNSPFKVGQGEVRRFKRLSRSAGLGVRFENDPHAQIFTVNYCLSEHAGQRCEVKLAVLNKFFLAPRWHRHTYLALAYTLWLQLPARYLFEVDNRYPQAIRARVRCIDGETSPVVDDGRFHTRAPTAVIQLVEEPSYYMVEPAIKG